MNLEMVLNELSLQNPAADIPTARQRMSELIKTLRAATAKGASRLLRTHSSLDTIELAPGYPVVRWRNDPAVDREERSFFRTLTAKAPFWSDVAEEIKNDFDLSQVWHHGEEAQGLAFALVIDALAISLKSQARWDWSCLQVEVMRLGERQDLIDDRVQILHASRSIHIQEHAAWIEQRSRIAARDGAELWKVKSELFPHLIFCEAVGAQIQSLSGGTPMLRQVVKRLFELENYCKTWRSGSFDLDNFPSKASPESDSRLQMFRQELTISCPDGKKRLFSLHLRMTPGAWRLHFSVELGPGKIIIGYIGPKIQ